MRGKLLSYWQQGSQRAEARCVMEAIPVLCWAMQLTRFGSGSDTSLGLDPKASPSDRGPEGWALSF